MTSSSHFVIQRTERYSNGGEPAERSMEMLALRQIRVPDGKELHYTKASLQIPATRINDTGRYFLVAIHLNL